MERGEREEKGEGGREREGGGGQRERELDMSNFLSGLKGRV